MDDPTKIFALSKIFHEPARLAIMTLLSARPEGVDFNGMRNTLKMTKGNLVVHVSKLEEAGYVEVLKEFLDRQPRTLYRTTALGREDFSIYLRRLEDIISQARKYA
ncbi:transcriptional regulator [Myxococcota bacterium]|nr:transcriptional regulator [Myxococcota bacterium]